MAAAFAVRITATDLPFLLLLEQVADLRKQQLLLRRGGCRSGCRGRLLLAGEPVHQLDHQKDAEGQDREVDALLDEGAVVPVDRFHGGRGDDRITCRDDVADRLHGVRRGVAQLRDVEPQLREVRVADQRPDRRHEDVVHERRDDLAERAADDDAHGHVHDVALEGELLEFLEKSHNDVQFDGLFPQR